MRSTGFRTAADVHADPVAFASGLVLRRGDLPGVPGRGLGRLALCATTLYGAGKPDAAEPHAWRRRSRPCRVAIAGV